MTTAMLNPATETIRVDRQYMPLLLQLKTAEAAAVDEKTTAAIAVLESAGVVRRGRLHPMADAILGLIAEPGLVVSVERLRAGTVAASTIWATQTAAAIGTRVDGGLYELRLTNPALLPFHLFQLVYLQPRPESHDFVHELPADLMFEAEGAIDRGDAAAATRLIATGAVDAAGAIVELLTSRIASWRVHSMWSTRDGAATATAYGMDCGRLGNVIVDIDSDGPTFRLRAAGFAEVTEELRATLPRSSQS